MFKKSLRKNKTIKDTKKPVLRRILSVKFKITIRDKNADDFISVSVLRNSLKNNIELAKLT